jgi:murein L,D-transpeptidase YcbB/YkuD
MRSVKARIIAVAAVLVVVVTGFNMSRMLQPAEPDLRLVLNVPASRLDVYENGKRTHSFEVSPGTREFATPAGRYHVREIIWNPWWHPPASKWAREEKPAPPGKYNPMGRIKINFADLLYIHGTQWEDHLGAPASHGCIRMGDADLIELAKIIHKYRTPKVDEQLLATLEENREMTRSFPVRPVQFDVVYQLVEVVDGHLVIHPDVYRQAGPSLSQQIVATLKKSGYEVSDQFEQRIESIAKTRKYTHVSVSIDSLFSTAAGD